MVGIECVGEKFFCIYFLRCWLDLQGVHRMSLAKAIRHGKERRNKRRRGWCCWSAGNRLYAINKGMEKSGYDIKMGNDERGDKKASDLISQMAR